MKNLTPFILLLFLLVGCQNAPNVANNPPVEDNGYTELEDDNIPLDEPSAIIDEELEFGMSNPTEDNPNKIYGEEIDKIKNQFRAATLNGFQLTNTTKNNLVQMKPPGVGAAKGVKKNQAILEFLAMSGVHIAAIQEVYSKKATIPLESKAGYKVIKGAPIVTNIKKIGTDFQSEYCPIAYRPSIFKCDSERTDTDARIHWASCDIKGTTITFYFGCGHFSTKRRTLDSNITHMYERLDEKKTATEHFHPRVPKAGKRDNFILGLDANSSPTGHQKSKWKKTDDNNKAKGTANLDKVVMPPLPNGAVTKIYKKGKGNAAKIKVTKNKAKQQIDFLIHSLTKEIKYVPLSMQVLNVRLINTGLNGQAFWKEYYKLSDHLPVKADFTY